MATPARKMKAAAVTAPETRVAAEAALQTIGVKQREIARLEADMNDRINELKAEYQAQIAPINEEIKENFQGLHIWAEANRKDLLVGRSKTVKMGTGEIAWRMAPPSCSVRGADAVIEALERQGKSEAIRLKKEVAKDVILNDPDAYRDIKGITVTQKEEFVVKPYETNVERVEVVK